VGQGKEIDLKENQGKRICVVVFFDTDVTHVQSVFRALPKSRNRFSDRNVVLVAVTGESSNVVESFIKKMGDNLNIAVGLDDQRKTYSAYMTAFEKTVIPHAFVVDNRGAIAWQGQSLGRLDNALDEIVSGRFDLENSKKIANAEKLLQEYFVLVSAGLENAKALEIGEKIVLDGARNPWLLNNFAWDILTDGRIKYRDRALAARAAKAACDLTGRKIQLLSIRTRVHCLNTGKTVEAIRMQREAIAVCKDPPQRLQLQQVLETYEKAGRSAAQIGKTRASCP
jgi:peroxiredoxin